MDENGSHGRCCQARRCTTALVQEVDGLLSRRIKASKKGLSVIFSMLLTKQMWSWACSIGPCGLVSIGCWPTNITLEKLPHQWATTSNLNRWIARQPTMWHGTCGFALIIVVQTSLSTDRLLWGIGPYGKISFSFTI